MSLAGTIFLSQGHTLSLGGWLMQGSSIPDFFLPQQKDHGNFAALSVGWAKDSFRGMSVLKCETDHRAIVSCVCGRQGPHECRNSGRFSWCMLRMETNPWKAGCSMVCQAVRWDCSCLKPGVLRNPQCRILVLSLWFKIPLHWRMMPSHPKALKAAPVIGVPTPVGWVTLHKISGAVESYSVRFNCINATIQFCQQSV